MNPITNVIVLVIVGGFVWLVQSVAIRKLTMRSQALLVYGFLGVLMLVMLFLALLTFQARAALAVLAAGPNVTRVAEVERQATGTAVILEGRVSTNNPLAYQDYVVYQQCDRDGICTLEGRLAFLVALQDGDVPIGNTDYEIRDWPGEGSKLFSTYYVKQLTPVIVVGFVERGTRMDTGSTVTAVKAQLVYVGTPAEFVERARSKMLAPTLLLAINVLAAVYVGGVLVFAWLRTRKLP